jgi:hypothetical protein
MQYMLTSKFGFSPNQIVILRDDDHSRGRDFIPYRDVIMRACSWLVANAKPGDSLFFQYSGHGGRLKDPTCEQQRLPDDFRVDVVAQLCFKPEQVGAQNTLHNMYRVEQVHGLG